MEPHLIIQTYPQPKIICSRIKETRTASNASVLIDALKKTLATQQPQSFSNAIESADLRATQ
jgi:hypothetical protein